MEERDIKVINTTKGELRYYRDWDNYEGGIVMINAQTVKRYREIKDQHPDADECGVFFAFSNQQFGEGYKHLVELGHIKKGDKVLRGVGGAYGIQDSGFVKKIRGSYSNVMGLPVEKLRKILKKEERNG